MKVYSYNKYQYLPVSRQEAWNFFSDPANLPLITPPEMGLTIISTLTGKPIYHGQMIDYRVKPLFGIPLHWETEIGWVEEPRNFVDKQHHGPYSLWEHTHTFTEVTGGVKIADEILYALPFGLLGTLFHGPLVRRRIDWIFDFREKKLIEMFGVFKPE